MRKLLPRPSLRSITSRASRGHPARWSSKRHTSFPASPAATGSACAREARPIAGCLIGGIEFQFLPAGTLSRYDAFIQVNVLGQPAPSGQQSQSVSTLIPISRITIPQPLEMRKGSA